MLSLPVAMAMAIARLCPLAGSDRFVFLPLCLCRADVDYQILAKGARNPFRSVINPKTGDIIFGDVGSAVWEVRLPIETLVGMFSQTHCWSERHGVPDSHTCEMAFCSVLTSLSFHGVYRRST